MTSTYTQGESWLQTLSLIKNNQAIQIGPAALTSTLLSTISVLLKSDGAVQAKYLYPQDPSKPDFLPLTIDPTLVNVLSFKVLREQSLQFTPGFLSACVLVELLDANFPAGRATEVVVPLGYLIKGETITLAQ